MNDTTQREDGFSGGSSKVLVGPMGREAALRLLGCADAHAVLADRRGEQVRDTPFRSTWAMDLTDGERGFRKHRHGRFRDARAEWKWLGSLERAGFVVPGRILLVGRGQDSVLVMRAVPGRALSDWILDASAADAVSSALRAYLLGPVARCLRRFHASGHVHRDLYWNHLFAATLGEGAPEPALIDVERVIRPLRIRRRRWLVKELGSLLGSWPESRLPTGLALRFLRAWSGGQLPRGWKRFARAIVRRAWRIRTHRPRYGSPPIWWHKESVRSP